jgi:hypothetical protein
MPGRLLLVPEMVRLVATTALWLSSSACSSQRVTDAALVHPEDTAAVSASRTIAFVGANVVSMRTSAIDRGRTVIVRDRRIVAIGAEASTPVPEGAFVVNARNGYLMPGLVDMHVHNAVRDAALYLPAGITTVRNLWGYPGLREYATRVINEELRAPTILNVSPGLDGRPASWPYTRFVDDVSVAGDTIRKVLGEGWSALKIYDRVSRAVFDSIITLAHGAGVRAIGHVPFAVPVDYALAAGQDEIQHLSGYERALSTRPNWGAIDDRLVPELVAKTTAANAWNCPTLAIFVQLYQQRPPSDRDAAIRNRRRFVKALHDGGARLLIGTDSGIDVVPAGSTIHAELAEFVAAGLTPYEALRAPTHDPAEYLGALDDFGIVDVGRRADLLLLDRNPLANVGNVRAFRGVVVRGWWLPRSLVTGQSSLRR